MTKNNIFSPKLVQQSTKKKKTDALRARRNCLPELHITMLKCIIFTENLENMPRKEKVW
jgi:hypothetical protein